MPESYPKSLSGQKFAGFSKIYQILSIAEQHHNKFDFDKLFQVTLIDRPFDIPGFRAVLNTAITKISSFRT